MMTTVLVVQPDEVQKDVLRHIFAKRVGAELVMVDSTLEAVDEIARRMPDLILLSALLSPRDEDALIAHLRTLPGASHLQTITIPQFRTAGARAPEKKGGLFRKKSKAPAPAGCDPMAFAEEVVAHLKDACELRNRPQATKPSLSATAEPAPEHLIDEPIASASAFDTTPFRSQYVAPEPEPFIAAPESCSMAPDAPVIQPDVIEPGAPPAEGVTRIEEVVRPAFAPTARVRPQSMEIEEIDRLSRELGLNLKYVDNAEQVLPSPAPIDEGDIFDFGAALDRARN